MIFSYSSLLLLGISSPRNYVFLKQRSRNLSKSWQFLFSKLSGVRIGLVVYHPLESTWHHSAFTAIFSPVKSKRIFSKSWNIFSTEIDNWPSVLRMSWGPGSLMDRNTKEIQLPNFGSPKVILVPHLWKHLHLPNVLTDEKVQIRGWRRGIFEPSMTRQEHL